MLAVRVGGKALFYAWALEQGTCTLKRSIALAAMHGCLLTLCCCINYLVDRGNRSGHRFATQDVLVPWHLNNRHLQSSESDKADGAPSKAKRTRKSRHVQATTTTIQNPQSESQQTSTSTTSTTTSTTSVVAQHAAYDETKQAMVLQRYCHVYREGELAALFEPISVRKWFFFHSAVGSSG